MTSYDKAVSENLAHLGTAKSEWAAVPMTGVAHVDGKPLPTFAFPADYTSAPSIFKNTAGGEMCCELCGHPIKTAFWIQHDTNRWTMIVGSECITHFSEKSGVELQQEALTAQNRRVLARLQEIRQALTQYRLKERWGFGKSFYWVNDEAQRDYQAISKALPGVDATDKHINMAVKRHQALIDRVFATYGGLLA